MATITAAPPVNDCAQTERGRLERVNYFPRQLLTADDMIADQEYFRQKMRRHNRFLHGWGAVCGLEVMASPTDDSPWRVKVGSGYALGPYGDEIYVGEAQTVDLAGCLATAGSDPCEPSNPNRPGDAARQRVYVAIRYSECFASPVLAMPGGCGCDDSACEYSRIRDSFEICCLTELPPSHKPPLICDLLTQGALPPCPPCPDDPWVVLAQVDLPASSGAEVSDSMINNVIVRRQLYSTAMLQEQLIHCCCKDHTDPKPTPIQVASVSPSDGQSFSSGSGPDAIKLIFNKDAQPATVNEQTVLVSFADPTGGQGGPVGGTVTYDAPTRTATFKPKDFIERVGDYKIAAKGADAKHIIDTDNLALDGNKDGVGGDDFISHFKVFQKPPA